VEVVDNTLTEVPPPAKGRPIRLSVQKWVWALSAVSPFRLVLVSDGADTTDSLCVRAMAPSLVLERLVKPWGAGLLSLLRCFITEASALAVANRSPGARASDVYRYKAAVRRGPSSRGPRWTPLALRLLGASLAMEPAEALEANAPIVLSRDDTADVVAPSGSKLGFVPDWSAQVAMQCNCIWS
jgi:hypothetical protein